MMNRRMVSRRLVLSEGCSRSSRSLSIRCGLRQWGRDLMEREEEIPCLTPIGGRKVETEESAAKSASRSGIGADDASCGASATARLRGQAGPRLVRGDEAVAVENAAADAGDAGRRTGERRGASSSPERRGGRAKGDPRSRERVRGAADVRDPAFSATPRWASCGDRLA